MGGIAGKSFFGFPRAERQESQPYLDGGIAIAVPTLEINLSRFHHLWDDFLLLISLARPASDGVALDLRVSANGATFDSGAGNYSYAFRTNDSTAAVGDTGTDNTAIGMTGGFIGNLANEGVSATVEMFRTADTTLWPRFKFQASYWDSSVTPRLAHTVGDAGRRAAQATRALQVFFSSGDIAYIQWALYGRRTFRV